jgi:hypothetical protein
VVCLVTAPCNDRLCYWYICKSLPYIYVYIIEVFFFQEGFKLFKDEIQVFIVKQTEFFDLPILKS